MENEMQYADLDWADENEIGITKTVTVAGRKWDVISINDFDDQILRTRCTKMNPIGLSEFDDEAYKVELLLKTVIKPKLTREFINKLRKNKKAGFFGKLVREVMDVSGVSMLTSEVEDEKNLESPMEFSH